MISKIPSFIQYILKVFLYSLVFMSCFRVFLLVMVQLNWTTLSDSSLYELGQMFLIGIQFDIVISSCIVLFPFIILSFLSFFKKISKPIIQSISILFSFIYGVIILAYCADIPYFLHFFSRLNTGALLWMDDSKYVLGLLFKDWSFLFFVFLYIVLIAFLIKTFRTLGKHFIEKQSEKDYKIIHNKSFYIKRLSTILVLVFCLIIGIRGRLQKKSTIRIGTSYFSDNQTLNKIALNPVFTFFHALYYDVYGQKDIKFMDNEKALLLSSKFLKRPNSNQNQYNSLHKKYVKSKHTSKNKNVVFVIMEGMGSYKLGKFGGPKGLTPNLNSLISKSMYFDNLYTAGTHTFNGIYSTLFSFPAIYKQQPLEELMNTNHDGIAEILTREGYTTSYFTTHDPEFDNVSGFLKANQYHHIYSELNYPKSWIVGPNGVPDHKMFDFALAKLTEHHEKGSPFFSALMTTSDHKPYVLPKNIDFKPKSKTLANQMIEYADWSIGQFIKEASKEAWFNNTLFVFVADHGLNMGHTYDMPLSYHLSPALIYNPEITIGDTIHKLAGQIDLGPTVLGLLGTQYENTTLGLDLLKYNRPFMYFSSDDKIGCLDDKHYLILRPDNHETLYQYSALKTDNFLQKYPLKVDSMKTYMFSMMQAAEILRK